MHGRSIEVAILDELLALHRKVDLVMAKLDDVKAAQAAEAAAIQQLSADVSAAISAGQAAAGALHNQILALQAQIAASGGTSVTAADLDALVATSAANVTSLNAIDGAVKAAAANLNPPSA